MPLSCHPCIDVNKREFLGDLSHHLVEERTNTKKGIIIKKCHVTTLERLNVSLDKGICKAY
jgi:hypothetical protein